jgi:hypothetical protein
MATVTVFTAARMEAIEGSSVVSGTVNGSGHLILTKHDGTTLDAGDVIGPVGPQGPVGEVTEVELNAAIAAAHAAGAITETQLATGSVTAIKIGTGAVTTVKVLDGNITAEKLASNSVTTIKILDGNVTAAKLASNSVTTVKVLDGNITAAKLSSTAVTNAKVSSTAAIALSKLATTGTMTATTFSGSGASLTNIPNSATTATSANTGSAIVARDGSGNFSTNAITANTFNGSFNGNLTGGQVVTTGTIYFSDYTDAGRFGVGTTSTSLGVLRVGNYTSGTTCITTNGNAATNYHMAFHYANSTVGGISSGTSSTSFNTTSDYRLKENVAPLTNALNILEQVKPKSFNFIIEPDEVQHGFIAHELAEVLPYAVTGEKDAVDEAGNIRPQQVDYSKLTGLLVCAVQELSTKVKELSARIEELETN